MTKNHKKTTNVLQFIEIFFIVLGTEFNIYSHSGQLRVDNDHYQPDTSCL
jgi:hypothetical protein